MKDKRTGIIGSMGIKIALVIILNLVGAYLYLRLDFSKGRIYTLGKSSKEAVKQLDDNFVVKVFASPELPVEFRYMDRYLKDLLGEFSLYSRNRFHFEYVDNKDKEKFRSLAIANGLNYNVVPIYENDQMAFKEVVYGMTFEYKNKREVLNLNAHLESRLEYEITTIVRTLSEAALPEIAVFRDSTYFFYSTEAFEKALSRNFRAYETDLNFIPPRAKVLLITGLYTSLSTEQLFAIDQFVMKGGKLVILQERVPLYSDPLKDIDSNFFELLEHYGVGIRKNLVMDINCEIQQMGMYDKVPFPIFPIVRGTDHPITKNMNDIVLYLASEVFPMNDSLKTVFQPLLRSSHNSNIMSSPNYSLDTFMMRSPTPDQFPMPPQTVGAYLSGELKSYFADSPLSGEEGFTGSVDNGGIIVYSDRELVVDITNPRFAHRWFIVLNAIDYFLGNDSMIKMRSRSIQSSVFNVKVYLESFDKLFYDVNALERQIKGVIRLIFILLPTLLLCILGLIVHFRYKTYKRNIAEKYEKA